MLRKGKSLYLLAGRTPLDPALSPLPGASQIWGDVWQSQDWGDTWTRVLETDTPGQWPARAYFQAVTHRGKLFVLGGQNFEIVENTECPPGPPYCPPFISGSEFFSDVWSSRDGVTWEMVTESAPWPAQAGAVVVVKNGYMYLTGGEDGFICLEGLRCPPYYNDVWRFSP